MIADINGKTVAIVITDGADSIERDSTGVPVAWWEALYGMPDCERNHATCFEANDPLTKYERGTC